jgi:hypothetical protein
MTSRAVSAFGAVTLAAAVWGAGAVPAGARVATRPAHATPAGAHLSAAGSYEATVPAARINSHLVITQGPEAANSGTFEFTDIGDYGNWITQGHSIAMMIASSEQGHAGVVLVGHVTPHGIAGWVDIPGWGQITWSATRDGSTASAAKRVASERNQLAAQEQQPPGNASGTYGVQFPQGPTFSDTLVLSHDRFSSRSGRFSLVNLADTGNWVQMGKHVALGISSGEDAGVVMIGTRTTSGFNGAGTPGHYFQPTSGVFDWYATKTS